MSVSWLIRINKGTTPTATMKLPLFLNWSGYARQSSEIRSS